MPAFLSALRDGSWLTRERVRLWTFALLIGFALGIGWLVATSHNGIDREGRPLGSDFSNVYTAGVAARHGDAARPFDPQSQYRAEQAIFGQATPFYGWHYPPYFLLIAAPLAALPYLAALALWQVASAILYLGALWLLVREGPLRRERLWPAVALGFTAVFVNLTHGHNGFLTAALFAGGLAFLDKRPLVAGMLFGLLAYKPQFAVLVPLVLVATARWRVLASATVTVAALTVLVTALFGWEVWPAFLASSHFTRTVVLEQGGTGFHKIQSVFAWVRLWGGPVSLAYAMQAMVSLAAAGGVVALWRSGASDALKGAALCCASVLATPYSLDYDLMILAPALVLLANEGLARGFRPWWASGLALLWAMPIVTRTFTQVTYLPLGTLAVLAAFAAICAAGLAPLSRMRTVSHV